MRDPYEVLRRVRRKALTKFAVSILIVAAVGTFIFLCGTDPAFPTADVAVRKTITHWVNPIILIAGGTFFCRCINVLEYLQGKVPPPRYDEPPMTE